MTRLPFFCPNKLTSSWRQIAAGVRMYPFAVPRALGMHLSVGTKYASAMVAQLSGQHAPRAAIEQWRAFEALLKKQDVLIVGPDVPPTLPFVHGRTVVSIIGGPTLEPGVSPLLKALIEQAKLVTLNFARSSVSAYGCLSSTGGFPVVIESEPCMACPWLMYLSLVGRRAGPITVIAGEGDTVVTPAAKALLGEQLPTATGRPS